MRQHYFWPMFCIAGQNKDDDMIHQILVNMNQNFGLIPTGDTIRDYVVPNLSISDPNQIIGNLFINQKQLLIFCRFFETCWCFFGSECFSFSH